MILNIKTIDLFTCDVIVLAVLFPYFDSNTLHLKHGHIQWVWQI